MTSHRKWASLSACICVGFAFTLLAFFGAFAQQPPVVGPQPGVNLQQLDAVVVYEQVNFGGQARTLGVGEHRLDGWKPSSIRVPRGFVAYLYQGADAAGGYGILVDVMESQADLSKFGLAGDVALVSVFRAERPDGFVWARGGMRNGQFVPGHWERRRARGGPDNAVAMASSTPSRAVYLPTAIQKQGPVWTITQLGKQPREGALLWDRAQKQSGVIGNDYRGPQYIGGAPVERASGVSYIPDSINIWYPNPANARGSSPYYKRTLAGTVSSAKRYDRDAPFPDHDLNLHITPSADYQHLIDQSHRPEKSTVEEVMDILPGEDATCTEPFTDIEAELDTPDSAKNKLVASLKGRVGLPVAVYGAWVYDVGHCHQPEIHPAEQIWWMEDTGTASDRRYHLGVFVDTSKRFWWRDQFDTDGGSLTQKRPWGAPPLNGVFAIAFEVTIDPVRATGKGRQFRLSNVDLQNLQSVPNASDVYNLVYGGTTLVSFVSNTLNFKVSYEHVGLKEGTTDVVRGFLVIETTVGRVSQKYTKPRDIYGREILNAPNYPMGTDPDTVPGQYERSLFEKVAGHYMFTLTESSTTNELQVLR